MNSLKSLFALVALMALMLAPTSAFAQQGDELATSDTLLTPQGWIDFGNSISTAILHGNKGEKQAALRHVVRYGRYLEFSNDAVFEVMRMYRDSKELRLRKMAVVALGNMNSRWALEFLNLSSGYETNEELLMTINSVLRQHRQKSGM